MVKQGNIPHMAKACVYSSHQCFSIDCFGEFGEKPGSDSIVVIQGEGFY